MTKVYFFLIIRGEKTTPGSSNTSISYIGFVVLSKGNTGNMGKFFSDTKNFVSLSTIDQFFRE